MFIKIINFDMKKLKRKMREEKEELIEYQIRSLDKTITRKKKYSRKFIWNLPNQQKDLEDNEIVQHKGNNENNYIDVQTCNIIFFFFFFRIVI